MPSLENLTLLRKLDLYETAIEELPKGMEKLINLRYLCLEKCSNLKMIPDGIFPQHCQMEWFKSDHLLRLRAEEIGSWRNLETFTGNFGDFGNLNTIFRLWEERGPTKYTIYVGLNTSIYEDDDEDYDSDKQVVVVENEDTEDTFALPSSTESLNLWRCNGIRRLSHIAPLRKANGLRKCRITGCNIMSHVVCSCRTCGNAPLSHCLEILDLFYLPMLTDLVERNMGSSYSSSTSVVPNNIFSSLKQLIIERCHKLDCLFTPAMLPALRCLEELYVCDCKELVEIVRDERIREDEDQHEDATTTTILSLPPNLKFLTLFRLPKLKSFCSSSIKLSDLPMLTDLVERNMGSSYSSSTSVVPNNIFSSLKELSIHKCNKLECLFTPVMLPALRCLEELYVCDCAELVEIVGNERTREDEDQHEDATTTTILSLPPNLKFLTLFRLPKLKSFCSSSIKLSDSLRTIVISSCRKLKRITLLWDELHPPTNIEQVKVLKEWWDSVEWKHPQTKAVLQPFVRYKS